jgi:cytochrome b561
MPIVNKPSRYGAVAQVLHWVIAVLIVVQFTLAYMADDLPIGIHKIALLARHKSFGMTILMLAIVRLAWRLTHPAPPLPEQMNKAERGLAHVSHVALYFLLFAMPLTGWMMSSAKNYSVSWFGLFTWPNLIGQNDDNFELLKNVHDTMSVVLLSLAVLHLLAAFKHHIWNKDDVLKRMLPFSKSEKKA